MRVRIKRFVLFFCICR